MGRSIGHAKGPRLDEPLNPWTPVSLSMGTEELRDCPRDHAALAGHPVSIERGTVSADLCPACHGLFLDRGEIDVLTSQAGLQNLLARRIILELDSQLECPGCGNVMEGENVGSVRLDLCLKCFGIWLDGGELDRLKGLDTKHLQNWAPGRIDHVLRARNAPAEEQAVAMTLLFRELGLRAQRLR